MPFSRVIAMRAGSLYGFQESNRFGMTKKFKKSMPSNTRGNLCDKCKRRLQPLLRLFHSIAVGQIWSCRLNSAHECRVAGLLGGKLAGTNLLNPFQTIDSRK